MMAAAQLPDIVIRASAGTGKTYQLANRFVRLLVGGAAPESILAATFTRKAAGEILERILLTLARGANDDRECAKLAMAIEQPQLSRPRCRELLARMTARLHRLQIGTIDSFFTRLASSFSLELGLPPGWSILDDVDSQRQRQEVIQSLLENASDRDLVKLLRLLAKGASQRTVSSLIEDTVENCHAVFLQTPAEAWRKVPMPPLPTGKDLKWSRRVLRELAAQAAAGKLQEAVAKDAEMADRDQWEEMLKKGVLKRLIEGETNYYRKPLDGETLDVYQQVLRHTAALVLNRLAKQTAATRDLLDKFDDEYREHQQRTGGCSFDDVARALSGQRQRRGDDPQRSLARQAFRLDARLSHLLLDEFQDTSPLQWSVLRPFVEQVVSKQRHPPQVTQQTLFGSPELPPSFFCVGDVKQAIYGWRGGDARIFDTLQRQLPELDSRPLDESYRSAKPIIDAVNLVFSRLPQHPELGRSQAAVNSWSQAFPQHTTAKKELPGHVRLMTTPAVGEDDDPKEITLRFAAQYVAEVFRQTTDQRLAKPPTIGVLTRHNAAVGQLIFELQSLGIPASEEAGNPLTDSAAVRLILSLLRIADHPGDTIARCHIATSPVGRLLTFTAIHDDMQAARLAETLRRQLLTDGYGACVAAWAKWLEPHSSPRDLSRLQQLTRVADTFQPAATLRTRDFIRLVEQTKLHDPSSDRVRVMNIHQSKGLQFDIVVLPELDSKLLGLEPTLVFGNEGDDPIAPPNAVCLHRAENIQELLPPGLKRLFEQSVEQRTHEALCLLYVAMTRAIHSLQMFVTPSDKPAKTFAGFLRSTLTDGGVAAPNKTLFEIGTKDWLTLPTTRTIAFRETPSPDRVTRTAAISFRTPLATPVRNLDRRKPSDHDTAPVRHLANSLQPINSAALDRGTLIHKWFEQIEWLADGRPTADQLLAAAKSLPPLSLVPANVLPDFFAMLSKPAIAQLLRRPTSAEPDVEYRVRREYPFAIRIDEQLIAGIIDRLVLCELDGRVVSAQVIDFKTDRVASDVELQNAIDNYRPQLETYRTAVSQLFELQPSDVSLQVVFVEPGVVSDVDDGE